MLSRRLCATVLTAAALLLDAPVASGHPAHPAQSARQQPTTMLNTLNASPDTVFSDDVLLGYLPVLAEQSSGPRFTVTRPTLLAHVGAFVNPYPDNYTAKDEAPFRVEIRRADSTGLPVAGEPLQVAPMTDDFDRLTWRYESARFDVLLQPGTYFALVSADSPRRGGFDPAHPGGGLLNATHDSQGLPAYVADTVTMAGFNRFTGTAFTFDVGIGFRILGCVTTRDKPHGPPCKVQRLL
jgi:hypothetical protein